MVLALAAGAGTVMVGKLFALSEEGASEKRPAAGGGSGVHGDVAGTSRGDTRSPVRRIPLRRGPGGTGRRPGLL